MKLNKSVLIKTLFLFVILFALAFSVNAALTINPGDSTDLGDIADDSSNTKTFQVGNSATEGDPLTSVAIQLSTPFENQADTNKKVTGATFDPNPITSLAFGATQDVTMSVNVPVKTYPGTYDGVVKVSTTTPTALEATQGFSFSVPIRYEMTVPDFVLNDVLIGKSYSTTFKLTNTGNKEFSITDIQKPNALTSAEGATLDVSGMAISLTSTSVGYLGEVTATVSLTVPTSQQEGKYTGENIIFTYADGKTKTVPLEINVRESRKSLKTSEGVVTLGGASQSRGIETPALAFTIENDGDEKVEGITVSSVAGLNNPYAVKFKKGSSEFADSIPAFSLEKGGSAEIQVKATVPTSQDSGIISIGSITIAATGLDDKSVGLNLNTKSMLEMVDNRIDVVYDSPDNDDIETDVEDSFNSGGKIYEVLPGSDLEFSLEVKSIFSDTKTEEKDIKIRNIDAEIILDRVDDGKDEKESESIDDLEAGDESETVEIKFTVPEEADEDNYNVIITIDGEDTNGASHKLEWTATLEVKKRDHFVEINKLKFENPVVYQGDRARLDFEIRNLGANKEDEAELEIVCEELEISKVYTKDDIHDLKQDLSNKKHKFSDTFEFEVKESFKAGTYKFKVKSYYDTDTESDYAETELTVKALAGQDDSTDDSSDDSSDDQTQTGGQQDQTDQGTSTEGTGAGQVIIDDKGFTDSTAYVVLLVIVAVLLLAILILLVVKFFI